jgi:hypothetical protein
MTLELGVHPAVSAASTQVTLLVSSATASAVYTATGAIPWGALRVFDRVSMKNRGPRA